MLSSLPNEILEDIFSRLSVKCLLCLKCVCTSWFAIISSPYFVKLHLNRSVQTKTNLSLYVCHDDYYWVDFYSLRDVLEPVKIDYHPGDNGLCCGSCDGLICMSNVDGVYLWNPSTRKSIKLPYAPVEVDFYRGYNYEFGYADDDYKVVRMVVSKNVDEEILDYEIKIYSLRLNLWHSVEKIYWTNFTSRECIVGGAMFWMDGDVRVKEESLIISLDLGTEKHRVIPNPKYSGPQYIINLDNFEGCLSLSCHYESEAVDVWLLKEYGGKNEYWLKFISLPPIKPRTNEELRSVKPVAYSKCGKKVLLEMSFDRLVWYNLEHEFVEPILVDLAPFFEVQPCLESLVSLDVPTEVVQPMMRRREKKYVSRFKHSYFFITS